MNTNVKGSLLALIAFALFATHDVFVKSLGADFSPFQVLFFSVVFGFPMFSLMLVGDASHGNLRPRHPWWSALRTLSILVAQGSTFYAFTVLPLAQTYAMLFTVPLIITVLAIPVLGERVGVHRGGAVLVGLIGVLIVLRPGSADLTLGHAVALLGALGTSLASVIVRRIGNEERTVVLLLYPMLMLFVVMGLTMPFDYRPMDLADLGAVVMVSLLGFVAMNCLIGAYTAGEAAVVAPMQYSQIIWAMIFGFFIFDELPDAATLLGASVIIASGFYIIYRESGANISNFTPVLRAQARTLGAVQSVMSIFRRG